MRAQANDLGCCLSGGTSSVFENVNVCEPFRAKSDVDFDNGCNDSIFFYFDYPCRLYPGRYARFAHRFPRQNAAKIAVKSRGIELQG